MYPALFYGISQENIYNNSEPSLFLLFSDVDILSEIIVVGGLYRLASAFCCNGAFKRKLLLFQNACVPAVTVEAGLKAERDNQHDQ